MTPGKRFPRRFTAPDFSINHILLFHSGPFWRSVMSHARVARKGFTLVELLVVIGIIALLISILLPSLNSARRSANKVKCLSNQKQIFVAFAMYANEFKNVFPAAIHSVGHGGSTATTPGSAGSIYIPVERRWYDLVAKYVVGKNIESTAAFATASGLDPVAQQTAQVGAIRANSVLWGCPEWNRIDLGNLDPAVAANDNLRPGYGMNIYLKRIFTRDNTTNDFNDAFANDTAWLTTGSLGGKARGRYQSQTKWAGRSSSENGLLYDSMTQTIQVPGAATLKDVDYNLVRTGGWQPGPPSSPYTNAGAAFYIDGQRHAKKGNARRSDVDQNCNTLFIDGHAATLSVQEAWTSVTGKQVQ
jgi:prepilin-type N-terminal cleavage/methylation domain-containing protein/prepilin-type processing-associated H-X9-DG protein